MVSFVVMRNGLKSNSASMEPCLFRHGKIRPKNYGKMDILTLQWSHVFSDMVREAYGGTRIRLLKLQWSHVFSDMVRKEARGEELTRKDSFNGAMSFQTW